MKTIVCSVRCVWRVESLFQHESFSSIARREASPEILEITHVTFSVRVRAGERISEPLT